MKIITLSIRNFRNFSTLNLEFDNRNIIFGNNGVGKTSILEAIHYFTILKSFRNSSDFNMIKKGESIFYLNLSGSRAEQDIKFIVEFEKGKKRISLNGEKLKNISQAFGVFSSVIISNHDKLLSSKNGKYRRSFMDRILSMSDSIYFEYLLKYHKLLKMRNAAIKSNQIKMSNIYIKQMSPLDEYIRQCRLEFTDYFKYIVNEIINEVFKKKMKLSIEYISSIKDKSLLHSIDNSIIQSEIRRGYTLLGIHREDIRIKIDNIDITMLGSEGEKRILGIVFKIAEINMLYENTGEYPIVLLDDILSEIDTHKKEQILYLFEKYPQIIATSPIDEHFPNYKKITINDSGTVVA